MFSLFPVVPTDGSLWILDTDYETFSSVWSCAELNGKLVAEFAWILGREKTFSLRDVS